MLFPLLIAFLLCWNKTYIRVVLYASRAYKDTCIEQDYRKISDSYSLHLSFHFFPAVVSGVPEDTVLIKGASAGAVTLVAPSDNSIANNAASAVAEAKKGGGAATSAAVAIENAEESAANAAPIKETIGVASANAVIGPSTGPIIIAGPTAPPLPIPVSTSEQPVVATVVETNSDSVSVASTATANLSVSGLIRTVERTEDGPSLATGERF